MLGDRRVLAVGGGYAASAEAVPVLMLPVLMLPVLADAGTGTPPGWEQALVLVPPVFPRPVLKPPEFAMPKFAVPAFPMPTLPVPAEESYVSVTGVERRCCGAARVGKLSNLTGAGE